VTDERERRWEERLRDGQSIVVRPIGPGDRETLAAGMRELSPESRYRRFLSPTEELSQAELSYLTEVDHHDHEALLAEERGTGAGIGVARFIRLEDPQVAEIALAVTDAWQGRGVGTILLQRLTDRAREEGIARFSAEVLAENATMLHMVRELGSVQQTDSRHGAVQVEVELPEEGVAAVLAKVLREAAGGLVHVRDLRRGQ
jgi:GNAT superfamily N-acetyltransferase